MAKKKEVFAARSYQIACEGGPQVVSGRVLGDFGVHQVSEMLDYWTVTHLPTGWAVRTGLKKRLAEKLARECYESGQWNIKNPKRPPAKLTKWAKDMAARYPNYLG